MSTEEGKICPLLFIGEALRSSHLPETSRDVCVCVKGECEMWRRFGEKGYCGLVGNAHQV